MSTLPPAVRPAHFKATWNTAAGTTVHYACSVHEAQLREHAEDRAPVFDVPPDERDRAGVWCEYCNV